MSDSSSKSDSTSSSSSSSSSDSSSSSKSKKFKVSRETIKSVSNWVVTGIDEKEVKKDRETFKPKLARKSELLTNPEMDESFYYRLKTIKNSRASKSNIDPIEKIYRSQTFKILDLAKPLLYLHSRANLKKKSRSDAKAIKIALRLWATLLNDVTRARRRNILTQIYPGFTSLLDNKKILPADGGEHLFGPKFIGELVDQMKTMNTMDIQAGDKSGVVPVTPLQRPARASTSAAAYGGSSQSNNNRYSGYNSSNHGGNYNNYRSGNNNYTNRGGNRGFNGNRVNQNGRKL
ncbi:uncharacterized protein LOC123474158 [Daphnia magna]|uniref:uncharacterized protein LOC123474158 n=1 Tax=Daphnia magna TaxID=35525 RepID=UPI001E1BA85A|nr:uncharacterized protein LOC123474158 [Daphnia magna]